MMVRICSNQSFESELLVSAGVPTAQVENFLPLYTENLLSEKSKELVDEHLFECENCRNLLKEMQTPDIKTTHSGDNLKHFSRRFFLHNLTLSAISVFITISALLMIWGVVFQRVEDEIGYSLVAFYLIMSLLSIICSAVWASGRSKTKFFAPIIFGAMGFMLPFTVFQSFDVICLFFAFIPSLIGLLIGLCVYSFNKDKYQ